MGLEPAFLWFSGSQVSVSATRLQPPMPWTPLRTSSPLTPGSHKLGPPWHELVCQAHPSDIRSDSDREHSGLWCFVMLLKPWMYMVPSLPLWAMNTYIAVVMMSSGWGTLHQHRPKGKKLQGYTYFCMYSWPFYHRQHYVLNCATVAVGWDQTSKPSPPHMHQWAIVALSPVHRLDRYW